MQGNKSRSPHNTDIHDRKQGNRHAGPTEAHTQQAPQGTIIIIVIIVTVIIIINHHHHDKQCDVCACSTTLVCTCSWCAHACFDLRLHMHVSTSFVCARMIVNVPVPCSALIRQHVDKTFCNADPSPHRQNSKHSSATNTNRPIGRTTKPIAPSE